MIGRETRHVLDELSGNGPSDARRTAYQQRPHGVSLLSSIGSAPAERKFTVGQSRFARRQSVVDRGDIEGQRVEL